MRLWISTGCLLLALAGAQAQARDAIGQRDVDRGLALAERLGVPVRWVDVPGKKDPMLALPVRAKDWPAFLETFNLGTGALTFKLNTRKKYAPLQHDNHLVLMGDTPGHFYRYARDHFSTGELAYHGFGNPAEPGNGAVLSLIDEQAAHAKEWLEKLAHPDDHLFECGKSGCHEYIGNLELGPGPDGTTTKRIVGNEEANHSMKVPAGLTLAQQQGIKRSTDGRAIFQKLVHQGQHTHIVLVPVDVPTRHQWQTINGRKVRKEVAQDGNPLERFARMGDEGILGRPPNRNTGIDSSHYTQDFAQYAEAAKHVGQRIFFANATGTPPELVNAIRQRAEADGRDVEGFTMTSGAPREVFSPTAHFHQHLFFVSAGNREAASRGHAKVIRDDLHGLSKRIDEGEFGFDTVVVRVSPANEQGEMSLGPVADLTMHAIQQVLADGGRIIGVVDESVPFTTGRNRIHKDQLSTVVFADNPAPEHLQAPAGEREEQIAAHLRELVPDGATLQIGIGAALQLVGEALKDKHDLTAWSEMGSDWLLPLMATEHPAMRKAVLSFALGSNDLMHFLDRNPEVSFNSTGVVNDPAAFARQEKPVAINTALQVSLTGKVNAEQIGDQRISSPGGQPNFMLGASMNKDGMAILAMRSETKTGESTLVLDLQGDEGHVTTPAENVDYVVTDQGSTERLRGLSESERTLQILRVASPRHQAALAKQAAERGLISDAQWQAFDPHGWLVFKLERLPPGERRGPAKEALDEGRLTQAEWEKIDLAARLIAELPAMSTEQRYQALKQARDKGQITEKERRQLSPRRIWRRTWRPGHEYAFEVSLDGWVEDTFVSGTQSGRVRMNVDTREVIPADLNNPPAPQVLGWARNSLFTPQKHPQESISYE